MAGQLARRPRPVDAGFRRGNLLGIGDAVFGLGHGFQRVPFQGGQGARPHQGPGLHRLVMQAGCCVGVCDTHGFRQQDRPGVQARLHLLDLDARHLIPGHDGPLDRRRPAPARQEGGVQVETAQPRRIERLLRQDLAVSDHGSEIEVQRSDLGDDLRVAETLRRGDRNAQHFGQLVDRRLLFALPPTPAARRLGVDARDLMPGGSDRGERAGGEVRRAHEGEAKRHVGPHSSAVEVAGVITSPTSCRQEKATS